MHVLDVRSNTGHRRVQSTATSQRVPPPPSVTVVEAKRMTVPIIVNPIGTTRALEEVTIRARVRGFLTERHFKDGSERQEGPALARDRQEAVPGRARSGQGPARGGQGIARKERRPPRPSRSRRPTWRWTRPSFASTKSKSAASASCWRARRRRRKTTTRPRPRSSRARPRSMPIRPTSNRPWPISRSTSKTPRPKSPGPGRARRRQINLGYCEMYAPIDGRIGELKVKVGNLVGDAGLTELVTIQQLDPMGLDLRPPARYLPEATALLGTGVARQPDRRRRTTPPARRQGDFHRQHRR